MIIRISRQHLSLGLLALASLTAVTPAIAAGTTAGTTISNLATVSYQVGGVAQPTIGSSPTGNSSGAGTGTTFVVDNKIDLTLIETAGAATVTSPGLVNVVTQYKLTNTGNGTQGYTLNAANLAGTSLFSQTDNFEMSNLRAYVSGTACSTATTVTPSYAGETTTSVASLAADSCVYVFIVADTPATSGSPAHPVNNDHANVRLTATTVTATTLATITETSGADTGGIDIVFADSATGGQTARDARAFADDQYAIQSASLSVQKTSVVVTDPLNGTTNPKAIPGATVEFTIVVSNTGLATATNVIITDPVPANTAAALGQYGGSGLDIQQQTGSGAATTCTASSADSDGCVIASGNLTVTIPSVLTGTANNRTVRFRVTIN